MVIHQMHKINFKNMEKLQNQKGIWAIDVEYSYKKVIRTKELYLWHI